MSATVFIEMQDNSVVRLTNTTGADVAKNEFGVFGGVPGVAVEAIVSGEVGPVQVEPFQIIQASDFVSGEGTFGTANASVYFDPSTKTFSDTSTTGYWLVGQVKEILSGGVIRVMLYPVATVVPA